MPNRRTIDGEDLEKLFINLSDRQIAHLYDLDEHDVASLRREHQNKSSANSNGKVDKGK